MDIEYIEYSTTMSKAAIDTEKNQQYHDDLKRLTKMIIEMRQTITELHNMYENLAEKIKNINT